MGWTLVLALICLTAAFFLFLQVNLNWILRPLSQTNKSHRKVFITGIQNTGKTVLFQQLTSPNEAVKPTVTSLEPNRGSFQPIIPMNDCLTDEERRQLYSGIEIIDWPGHGNAQMTLVEQELAEADAIIFLVDTVAKKTMREAASFLFSILSSAAWQKRRQPLCVLLNKLGLPDARHKNLVREDLEREIERLKRLYYTAPLKADVISRNQRSWWRLVASKLKITDPNVIKKSESARQQLRLAKEENSMFKLATLDTKLSVLVQNEDSNRNVENVRGFIQRAIHL